MMFIKGGERVKKNKRGISPLIATVLLIGFTIVLAALVMRWGGELFETTTKTTGCTSLAVIKCAQAVDVEITDVDNDTGASPINVTINNNGGAIDAGFFIKATDTTGTTTTIKVTQSLDAYSSGVFNARDSDTPTKIIPGGSYNEVEVIPIITEIDEEGNECTEVCTQKSVTFNL